MKYCQKCGNQLDDNAVVCPKCGCAVPREFSRPRKRDASSFGYAVLGFFIPIVGLILYLVWKNETPLKAKSAGKGALTGVIVSVILEIVYVCLIIALFKTLPDDFLYIFKDLPGIP